MHKGRPWWWGLLIPVNSLIVLCGRDKVCALRKGQGDPGLGDVCWMINSGTSNQTNCYVDILEGNILVRPLNVLPINIM